MSVTQVYLQVTKRVQPNLAKGKDCLSVSYTHKVRITERVPQHPKNRRKTRATRLATDWRMLPQRQLLNKGRAAWCAPCAGAFASFARQKKDTDSTAPNDCNQKLRVKQTFELLRLQPLTRLINLANSALLRKESSNHCTQICINKEIGAYTSLNVEF